MPVYDHDSVVPFPESEQGKKHQIADMFNRIAFRYDFLNHLLSGGLDRYWRKRAIQELAGRPLKRVLDVATGTGDLAILLAERLKPGSITAIDISEGMLQKARDKIGKSGRLESLHLQAADCEQLPFPDNHFDAITVGFGVRNFENLEQGLSEMRRVLEPGGKLIILEFSRPNGKTAQYLCDFYLSRIACRLGRWISGNRDAYSYLNESVAAFPNGERFLSILIRLGYESSYRIPLTLGICTIYCGSKPQDPSSRSK
jgi:demethylmenaquinone methyltransferase/2-methoxy-6-polyprenyl-1,4-benzoquinol methylase